jgi:hypothetical protein
MRRIGIALAAAALVAGAAPAAHAAQLSGSLTLWITPHDGGPVTAVSLTCEPTGGTHPDASAACEDLIAAKGDIPSIPPSGIICLPYEDRVTVGAYGTWDGRSVSYSREFTNDGCANIATGGHVFNF